jgi:hypothetical protein
MTVGHIVREGEGKNVTVGSPTGEEITGESGSIAEMAGIAGASFTR